MPCPPYRIAVYDTLPMDSRVDVVRVLEDSSTNVEWRIERKTLLPEDSVIVHVRLRDPYEDGVVTIFAEDAERFVTVKRFQLPGMTLRGVSANATVERLPLRYTYRTATKRTWCFPLLYVNVGFSPQTVLRAESARGSLRNASLPAVVGRQDTLQLQVCYRADRTETITDTLWLETPCGRYAAAIFTIEFIVDTVAPRVLRAEQPCPPVHTLTIMEMGTTESGIAAIEVLDSANITIDVLGGGDGSYWLAEQQTLRISQRDWRLDGWYRMSVTDSSGNSSTTSGSFEGHTVMITNRDSLAAIQTFRAASNSFLCDTLELYNYGGYPKRFDKLVIRGIEFAPPPSYLPLVLAPGQRVRVPVCALLPPFRASSENIYRDTLELVVGCFVRRMPVEITITAPSYSAESSCGVVVGTPPANNTPTLIRDGGSIELLLPSSGDWQLALYATSGQLLWQTQSTGTRARWDMERLPPGAYWLIGINGTAMLRVPVLWTGQ
ncbi:MAG: hypothetical protein D6747_02420 [Chlorobiota bacterium]|nr:MAG: hypothetical protein D6747_02420 [Chlorobiota bacterium]